MVFALISTPVGNDVVPNGKNIFPVKVDIIGVNDILELTEEKHDIDII
jgi:hypothetical protein